MIVPVGTKSEVAALVACIEAEYQAAHEALYGYSEGTVRHAVISARMSRAQAASKQLIAVLGEQAALPLIVEALDGSQPS